MKQIYLIMLILLALSACQGVQYRLNNEAMIPAIPQGSLLEVNKDISTLEYGDIIVFNCDQDRYYFDEENYVEIINPIICRIVALPLDSLSIENDICSVNGKKDKTRLIKHEYFVNEYENEMPNGFKMNILSMSHRNKEFGLEGKLDLAPIQIPADHYFAMGDNRSDVFDSRHFGSIPRSRIIGKVIRITPP